MEVWRQSRFQTTPKKYNFDCFRTGPCPCRRSAPKEETTRSGASDTPSGRARHGGRTRAATVSISVSSRDANMHGHISRIWGRDLKCLKNNLLANIVRRGRHPSILGWLPRRVTRSSDENLPTKGRRFSYWMMSNVFILKKYWHSIFLPVIVLSKRDVDRCSDKKNYMQYSFRIFLRSVKKLLGCTYFNGVMLCQLSCHGAFSVFLRIFIFISTTRYSVSSRYS